jgi:hypothetical protein
MSTITKITISISMLRSFERFNNVEVGGSIELTLLETDNPGIIWNEAALKLRNKIIAEIENAIEAAKEMDVYQAITNTIDNISRHSTVRSIEHLRKRILDLSPFYEERKIELDKRLVDSYTAELIAGVEESLNHKATYEIKQYEDNPYLPEKWRTAITNYLANDTPF